MEIKRTSLYIDSELLKELKKLALEKDMKVNELIIQIIKYELRQE